jgi:NAD(P)-dependent dehydrogenase (short-subunit alcohol dehydrogenase family)
VWIFLHEDRRSSVERACGGRVAIVTGASRGLGAAIAERLAAEGARVAAVARTLEPDERFPGSLAETVERITSAGGEAVAIQSDLSKDDERRRLVTETVERLGPVDILVNNAAVTFLLPFDDFPERRFRLMIEMQVWAPFHLAQLVVPSMKERGEGWILNITSRAANHAAGPPFDEVQKAGFSVYGACKAALDRFSNALAAELHDHNIAVNALAPWDNVATPGAGHHDLVDGFALEGPEWIAEAALLLCSTPPRQLTGRVAYSQPLCAEFQRVPHQQST